MLKSHERFHSTNGKRQILVADDEFVNRELLRAVLQSDYELIFATNGREALDYMSENWDTLSLVLLDLIMPVMDGLDLLREVKVDPVLSNIPIIVISADQDAEIECLTLGAIDFIPKPYPQAGVIKARIRRTIELSEDRQIINSTERDTLTGLYNREYFYRYAEHYDQHHKGTDMDAIVVDINHFRMINERFGTSYGDEVLRMMADSLRSKVLDLDGMVCRREADTFMVYCPHGLNYEELLDYVSDSIAGERDDPGHVWLRMGVYPHVDKTLDIERRFVRAKTASDTVRGSFARRIGFYDSALHEQQLYSEQLIEDFDAAIREGQFQVYYQPSFDVQLDIPVLASAEALARWNHPTLGMVSPGVFITLFEENGLIQRLDRYVWRTTAAQIRSWKDRFDFSVPVSVNVSRVDMYDPHLTDTLAQLLDEYQLSPSDLLLEITESAHTQDSEQIVATVSNLRNMGFRVEMDDFGTGYSSLNMISTLPIDALKLDMQFIRNAFSDHKDTRMLEVIIDIADYLSVPVIAEGVETEEQLIALREMGCDFVQGYYFSRPVPAEEYERFLLERKQQVSEGVDTRRETHRRSASSHESTFGDIAFALSSGFEVIYYVDMESGQYVEFSSRGRSEDLQLESSGSSFFADVENRLLPFVHPDDAMRVRLCLQRDVLFAHLAGIDPFTITYRTRTVGNPLYYSLKAVRARAHDDHHVVIGISNVDALVRQATGEEPNNELDFGALAQALSDDIDSVYYVDIATGWFQEFRRSTSHGRLTRRTEGDDFFGEVVQGVREMVHPDDQEKVLWAFGRPVLLASLRERAAFSMTCRMLVDGKARHYRLKAVRHEHNGMEHLVIGVSDVDDQVNEELRLDEQRRSAITYASIVQSLATDYFGIYYVDVETEHFLAYAFQTRYYELSIGQEGDGFFSSVKGIIEQVVNPDDVEMLSSALTKENVLATLEKMPSLSITFRTASPRLPKYVNMKVTRMGDSDDPHIVVGLSNVDEQMRREQDHARVLRMANQDALTGVKSKHAYSAEEHRIDQAIVDATQEPFAIVVCDINGLKRVNDTLGHAAGDRFIKDACAMVCDVFKHSPVFRIGGDKFVAILRGTDYEHREQLMDTLRSGNEQNEAAGVATVAGGIAVWEPQKDATFAQVFERADSAMYAHKEQWRLRHEA